MKQTKSKKLNSLLDSHLKLMSKEITKQGKSFFNSLEIKSPESNINPAVLKEYSNMLLNIYSCWTIEMIKNKYLFVKSTCFHFKKLDDLHKKYIDLATECEHAAVKALQATEESEIKKNFVKNWNDEHKSIPLALNTQELPVEIVELMEKYWKITV